MGVIFKNRKEAGVLLGKELLKIGITKYKNVVIVALPRGGVPVAFEIAKLLNSHMDVLFARKLGLPHNQEIAMGAITEDDTLFLDERLIRIYSISLRTVEKIIAREKKTIEKRKIDYRDICNKKEVKGKIVILVDDGLATGATMFAAVQSLRKELPLKIIIAVPVSPLETYNKLKKYADKIISLNIPEPFYGVGGCYLDFPQVSDEEVCNLLAQCENKNKENIL